MKIHLIPHTEFDAFEDLGGSFDRMKLPPARPTSTDYGAYLHRMPPIQPQRGYESKCGANISNFMVSSQVSLTHGGDSNCCYYPTGLEETRRTVVKPVKPHVSRFLCSISITDPTGIETHRDDFHVNNITQ